jgi:hypothetical protein
LAFHLGREADHSPPSSAEVKEWVELYLHSPNTPSWRAAQLGGAQGQLYLTFTFSRLLEFCKHGNKPLDSIKSGRLLTKLISTTSQLKILYYE